MLVGLVNCALLCLEMNIEPFYAIVDVRMAINAGWSVRDLTKAFLDGGARLLQLRGENCETGHLQRLCDEMVDIADRYGAGIIVNDRFDIAKLGGASGVHLGQADLTVLAARQFLGPIAAIGVSTHTVTELHEACSTEVNYVAVGPVFRTQTKTKGRSPIGLSGVRDAAKRSEKHPVVAIGGINLNRVVPVIEAGANAVAVISDLLVGGSPERRVKAYLDVLASVCPK